MKQTVRRDASDGILEYNIDVDLAREMESERVRKSDPAYLRMIKAHTDADNREPIQPGITAATYP